MAKRPPIPLDIKREVRKRCGFGCVICGIPLYEYEHMLKWSVVKRHVASEITLLCRFHHGQRTNELLPADVVRQANQNPYNLVVGKTASVGLYFSGKEVEIKIGGNSFSLREMRDGEFLCPIVIDRKKIISFTLQGGMLFLDLNFYDQDNNLILKVVKNEIVISSGVWDIEWIAKKLTIRNSPKRIFLELSLEPPGLVIIERGVVMYNGIEFVIGRDYIFNSNKFHIVSGMSFANIPYGLSCGEPPKDGGVCFNYQFSDRTILDRAESRRELRRQLKMIKG